jgi:hypothetical protein
MTYFSNIVDGVSPRWGFHLCGSDDMVVCVLFACFEVIMLYLSLAMTKIIAKLLNRGQCSRWKFNL